MKLVPTGLAGVMIIEPRVFGDERGFFFESWNERSFAELGINAHFVQDNHSRSSKGVLRGLHYQIVQPQGKLLRVVSGEIYDVVVDIRKGSPSFSRHVAVRLSASNRNMLWVPEGYAHGFLVTTETAEVLYKTTDFYAPEHERSIAWNDPDLAIPWPLEGPPTLSKKDMQGVRLKDAELYD